MGGFLISSFLLPYIANRWPDKNALAPLIRMCRHVLMLSSLCIAIVVAHWSDDVNNLLYNGRDISAGNVIAVLLFTLPALGLVHIYGTLLTATGNIIRFMIISAFFALINITFNLIFIPQFGLSAAMWIAVITQTLYAIVVCFDAVKQTTIKFAFSDLLIYLAVAAALLLCLNHLF
jgi:O-antigen/teichoic acid export membrane protein